MPWIITLCNAWVQGSWNGLLQKGWYRFSWVGASEGERPQEFRQHPVQDTAWGRPCFLLEMKPFLHVPADLEGWEEGPSSAYHRPQQRERESRWGYSCNISVITFLWLRKASKAQPHSHHSWWMDWRLKITCSRGPCWCGKAGLDDLQCTLPTLTILWLWKNTVQQDTSLASMACINISLFLSTGNGLCTSVQLKSVTKSKWLINKT